MTSKSIWQNTMGWWWDDESGASAGPFSTEREAQIEQNRYCMYALEGLKDTAEDQLTISKWAAETFGPVANNASIAARALEELAELLRALTADDRHPKTAEEVADVFIVLYRLGHELGFDVHAEIDKKMAINRARKWVLDGDGHGRHVK